MNFNGYSFLRASTNPHQLMSDTLVLLLHCRWQIGRPLPSVVSHPLLYAAVIVSWTTPPVYGGAAIAGFIIRWVRASRRTTCQDASTVSDDCGDERDLQWAQCQAGRMDGSSGMCRVGGNEREYVVDGLRPGWSYLFTVAAVADFTPYPLPPVDGEHIRRVIVRLPCCGGKEMLSEPVRIHIPRRPGPCSAGKRLPLGIACVCGLDVPISSPLTPFRPAFGDEYLNPAGQDHHFDSVPVCQEPWTQQSGYVVKQRYCSNSLAVWWHVPRQYGSIQITGYRVLVTRRIPSNIPSDERGDEVLNQEELSVSVSDARLVGHLLRSAGRCAFASRHIPERPSKIGGDETETASAAEISIVAGSQEEAWAGHLAWRHGTLHDDATCMAKQADETQGTADSNAALVLDERIDCNKAENDECTEGRNSDESSDEMSADGIESQELKSGGEQKVREGEICAYLLPLLGASVVEVTVRVADILRRAH
jgi:hypothetical protein